MNVKSLSFNPYFKLGLVYCGLSIHYPDDSNAYIIDLNMRFLKKTLSFLEKETFQYVIIYCNDYNMLPLAFFLKKKYKQVYVWCNYKSFIRFNSNNIGVDKKNIIFDRKVIIINHHKHCVTYTEFDLLCSLINKVNIKEYIKKHKITQQTYYKHRRLLMRKLNVNKISLQTAG